MLKQYAIENNRLVESSGKEPGVLVYIAPDENERKHLVTSLGLDEHTLNSAMDPDELARLEWEPEHAAVILKIPKNYSAEDQFLFKVSSMGLFLFKGKLVVILPEDRPMFVGKIFNSVESPAEALLKIIYASIYHYLEHLKVINMISDEIERKINVSMENKYLLNLFTLEKSLVYYLNAINSNGFVIEKLRHNIERIGFSQRSAEFLDDIIIENNQCYRQAEIYSNILAGLMDARVSIVSNNLNIWMKNLNLITIGIMVPTLVVSAFSMNVSIPMQHWPHVFWIIMALAAISAVGVLIWWKSRRRF